MVFPGQSLAPIGTIVAGKFRITREVGRGGMATVFEAENIDIGKRVAVKLLSPELLTSQVVRERFIREARAAAAVRSPYICDVYDAGLFEERPFLVMELLEGETLYEMMTRLRRLDAETTLRIITHAARGLQKAHEANIVHRDLKPENIFLTKDEDGKLLAKIVDFGLAKFYESDASEPGSVRITREGALFGTPAYMSPEQAKGHGQVDHRADLWALGCMVYECLVGRTVWSVEQGVAMILAQIASAPLPCPSAVQAGLPPAFDAWFAKALARDPGERFQSAREMADELARALVPQGVAAVSFFPSPDVSMANFAATLDTPILTSPGNTALGSPTQESERSSVRTRPSGGKEWWLTLGGIALFAGLAVGGYYVTRRKDHPVLNKPAPVVASVVTTPTLKDAGATPSADAESYREKLARAQEMLGTGQGKPALEMFRAAFQLEQAPVARSLFAHISTAQEENTGKCQLTGLGHPRPFNLDAQVQRPTLAVTDEGVVFAWIDHHQDPKLRQVYTVLLDRALRPVTPEVSVTPEAHAAQHPQLLRAGKKLVLVYSDDSGNEPGVFVRLLDSKGRTSGPARRLSGATKGEVFPSLAQMENGKFWGVWEEELDKGTTDLVARELSAELEPLGNPVRLTDLLPVSGVTSTANTPDIVVSRGQLLVVYSVARAVDRYQIQMMRVGLKDPVLRTGLKPVRRGARPVERHAGTVVMVSPTTGKNTAPHLACTLDGCFIAWDVEKAGAFVSFIAKGQDKPAWTQELTRRAYRPALGMQGPNAVVAWYGESRLRFAALSKTGVGVESVLGKVSGFQPQPDIVAGGKSEEWYISWRDFEAAHPEVFALRTQCQ